MKKTLALSAISSILCLSNVQAFELPKMDESKVYIQTNSHQIDAPDSIGTLTVEKIDKSSIGIGITQYFVPVYLPKEDYRCFIDVNYSKAEDRTFTKAGIGIEKKLDEKDGAIPYVGFNLGIFNESWNKDPLRTNSGAKSGADLDNNGLYLGIQVGATKKLDDKYTMDLFAQYSLIDNKKEITTASGGKDTIKEDGILSIGIGLRF